MPFRNFVPVDGQVPTATLAFLSSGGLPEQPPYPEPSLLYAGHGSGAGGSGGGRRGTERVGRGRAVPPATSWEEEGEGAGAPELLCRVYGTEVEEDFLRMTGYKPPRRCRLGRRKVDPDYLSRVFPGSWLPNRITADWYKVAEPSNPTEDQIQSQGIEG